jgi:hypothetical protein
MAPEELPEIKFATPEPGSKSTVPEKEPDKNTFPERSTATELPRVRPEETPKLFVQSKSPDEFNFDTNASSYPRDAQEKFAEPGSKSAS